MLLLALSFLFAVVAASITWREAPAAAAWTVAGALLALAATGGLLLQRDTAEKAALRAQLALGAARLEKYSNAHGHFVDGLAHEIRTPLTILMNQAELLLRCSDDPAAVSVHARSVADYLLHLSDLVEGFVRLGSPLVAADTSDHVPVHVHDLVIEAVRRSQSMARNGGVHVVATIPEPDGEDRALEVLGSEVLLAAMIESLVRAAVRRSPRGSQVELQVQVRGESILLRVRDQGMEIAPSQLESVFDWYSKAPGAERDSHRTGNLAIAKRVAEHHRGTISLRNHPGSGCEFEVALPRWRDPAPRSEHAVQRSADETMRSNGARSPARTQPLARRT